MMSGDTQQIDGADALAVDSAPTAQLDRAVWFGKWKAIGIGLAVIVGARGLMALQGELLPGLGLLALGVASVSVMIAAHSIIPPHELRAYAPPESPLLALLWRLNLAREWAVEAKVALLFSLGAAVGALGIGIFYEASHGAGLDFYNVILLGVFVALLTTPIMVPAAMVGIALCPPATGPPGRLARVMFAGGGFSGGCAIFVSLEVVRAGAVLPDFLRGIMFDIYVFVLPVLGTFALVRLMLALGVLRRVEGVSEDAAGSAHADEDGGAG